MSRRWHRTETAAERLNLSPTTLVGYRVRNIGPAYSKIGRVCLYDEADLDAWVASQRVEPGMKHSTTLEAA